MSTVRKHKKRIMEHLIGLRTEICICIEHGHIKYPPKRLQDYEQDTDKLLCEIEKTEFIERKQDMNGEKKWYLSKGVDGALVAMITTIVLIVMKVLGYNGEAEQVNIAEIVTMAIGLIGAVIALIGRLKAKSVIK